MQTLYVYFHVALESLLKLQSFFFVISLDKKTSIHLFITFIIIIIFPSLTDVEMGKNVPEEKESSYQSPSLELILSC